jgi:hypothetical protein
VFFSFVILLCAVARGELIYYGCSESVAEITFEDAGDGSEQARLTFLVREGVGSVHEWREVVKPGGNLLGYRVTLDRVADRIVARLRPFHPKSDSTVVRLHTPDTFTLSRGIFATWDRSSTTMAYAGDEFTLGSSKARVLELLDSDATVQIDGRDGPLTLLLPPFTGTNLFSDVSHLKSQMERFEAENYYYEPTQICEILCMETGLWLMMGYLFIYTAILVGWITRDEYPLLPSQQRVLCRLNSKFSR